MSSKPFLVHLTFNESFAGLEINEMFNSKGNDIGKQKIAQMITFMKFLYHKSVKNKTVFNYGVGYR